MMMDILPSAVFVYVKANGKYLDVSERGLELLELYLKFSSHENNDKVCTFSQFAHFTSEETMSEFRDEFLMPALENIGRDMVSNNDCDNPSRWYVRLEALVVRINEAKQKALETPKKEDVKKMRYMLDHQDWSVIYNPRVFDVELYLKDKGSQHREEREFPITLEYEHVEAWAEFFNGLVADLKERGKLK